MFVPARRLDPEWMDRPDNSPSELAGALEDIRTVNRFLGGSKVLLDAIAPYLDAAPAGSVTTILDVGTGGADLPIAMAAAARRRGRRVRVVGLDRDPVTVDLARRAAADCPEVEIVRGDAFALGYPDASFDLVTASLFLHHFPHDEAARLIAGFRRVARRAVFVNDLQRHRIPWAFIALTSRLTRRHPMFVHDAPLSVLRGFTEDELRRIASDAGAPHADVARCWPFRLLLTVPGLGGTS